MTDRRDPQKAIDYILKEAPNFAAAKAQRVQIEAFMKSKKALLMNESAEKAFNAREQFAYAHPDYIALGYGLQAAVEQEESIKWRLEAAKMAVDVWRSQEASNRGQDRSTR